jgi:hypothetical protein
MNRKHTAFLATSATMVLSLLSMPTSLAQAATTDGGASGTSMTKEELTAQKKADKQARRRRKTRN